MADSDLGEFRHADRGGGQAPAPPPQQGHVVVFTRGSSNANTDNDQLLDLGLHSYHCTTEDPCLRRPRPQSGMCEFRPRMWNKSRLREGATADERPPHDSQNRIMRIFR